MADDRPHGYEYDHSFRIDNEIVKIHNRNHGQQQQRCLFEFRSSFIIKTIDGPDHIIGSEKFAHRSDLDGQDLLFLRLRHRLIEYWMSRAEIRRVANDAFAFAKKAPANIMPLIPIVVDLKIRTVQRPNERLDSVMNRAVRVENLIPVFLSSDAGEPDREIGYNVAVLRFLQDLQRIRVRDVGQGSALMRVCHVCEAGPHVGAQISVLPGCNHAFHSGCISRWLLEDNLCPLCQLPVYQNSYLSDRRKEFEEIKSKNILPP